MANDAEDYIAAVADACAAAGREGDAALWIGAMGRLADEDVPRLLAAVDAALKLAAEWETDAAELDRDVVVSRRSPYPGDHQLADTDAEIAKKLRDHATDLRAAILAALTGEGTSDGK